MLLRYTHKIKRYIFKKKEGFACNVQEFTERKKNQFSQLFLVDPPDQPFFQAGE